MAGRIPHELWDRVIDFLHDDPKALLACSITCRSWLPGARYHHWSCTSLPAYRLSKFNALLVSSESSGLRQSITTLDIRSIVVIRSLDGNLLHSVLDKLPLLRHLSLRLFALTEEAVDILKANKTFADLVELSLQSCLFSGINKLAELLVTPPLTAVSLENVEFCQDAAEAPIPSCEGPSLKKLTLYGLSSPEMAEIFGWICRAGPIGIFSTCICDKEESAAAKHALTSIGDSLTELDLLVDADANLQAVFEESLFTLEHVVNLRSYRLSFNLREMCVPSNRSLPWISTLLGQLASKDLEEIVLRIKADSMTDLRALDSECGVRRPHPVLYDDLVALDWERLDNSVRSGVLASLDRIVVEGTGEATTFISHVHREHPALAVLFRLSAAPPA